MGCIPPLIDSLSTVDSSSNSYGWYIGAVIIIFSIILTFMRKKLPPAALDSLAHQIIEIDEVLTTSTRILDPCFVFDCNTIIEG